ncbi:MAG: radical SAM protein [Candidatus Aminicenantes bacterium]|nr:MAG: radical SAM protein [Candidatus Aminicenantes bacterium]
MRQSVKILFSCALFLLIVANVLPFLHLPISQSINKFVAPIGNMISVLFVFAGLWLSIRTEGLVASILERLGLISSATNYLELAHKYYSLARDDEVIYTCTSTWPILPEKRKVLMNLKPWDIVFLGPIDVGPYFPGILWKYRISLDRLDSAKRRPFQIWHREERSIKFIVAGQTVLLSGAHHNEPSTSGFLFENSSSHARLYKAVLQELFMKGSVPFEARLMSLARGIIDKRLSVGDFCDRLCAGASEQRGFPRSEWIRTLTEIIQSSPRLLKALKLRWDSEMNSYFVENPEDSIVRTELDKGRALSSQRAMELSFPALRIVLTPQCNFKCCYCPKSDENYAKCGKPITIEKMALIGKIALDMGFEHIRLTGGEPLLLGESFLELVEKLHSHSSLSSLRLATNGLLLEKFAKRIATFNKISLKVSLDTLNPGKFEDITGIQGLNTVLNGIHAARKEGLSIIINTVVTKKNIDEMESLIEYCIQNGLDLKLLDLNNYSDLPRNYWRDNYVPLANFADRLINKYGNDRIVNTVGNFGIPMLELIINKDTRVRIKDSSLGSHYGRICIRCKKFPCQEGLFQFTVTSDGKIKPCRHRPSLAVDLSRFLSMSNGRFIEREIKRALDNIYWGAFYAPNAEISKWEVGVNGSKS